MVDNLKDYFEEQHLFYLKKAGYERLDDEQTQEYVGQCSDTVNAFKDGNKVVVLFERAFHFLPDGLFTVAVEYGAILTIKESMIDQIAWEEIDLSKEFTENGDFVLRNLIVRSSQLIGDITASYGQPPVITPPTIVDSKNNLA